VCVCVFVCECVCVVCGLPSKCVTMMCTAGDLLCGSWFVGYCVVRGLLSECVMMLCTEDESKKYVCISWVTQYVCDVLCTTGVSAVYFVGYPVCV